MTVDVAAAPHRPGMNPNMTPEAQAHFMASFHSYVRACHDGPDGPRKFNPAGVMPTAFQRQAETVLGEIGRHTGEDLAQALQRAGQIAGFFWVRAGQLREQNPRQAESDMGFAKTLFRACGMGGQAVPHFIPPAALAA